MRVCKHLTLRWIMGTFNSKARCDNCKIELTEDELMEHMDNLINRLLDKEGDQAWLK